MSNPNGKKGSSYERAIADYLRDEWPDPSSEFIDRRVKTGGKDKGDIANVRLGSHRLVVECKNSVEYRKNLPAWLAETVEETANDAALAGILVHKRMGKGKPEDQYVTMTLDSLITLLFASRASE